MYYFGRIVYILIKDKHMRIFSYLKNLWFKLLRFKVKKGQLKLLSGFLLLTSMYMTLGVFIFTAVLPAQAQEADSGSIQIWKEAFTINDISFEFSGDLGSFFLEPNTKITFADLSPGVYTVIEELMPGWSLDKIYVVGDFYANSVKDEANRSVEVHLEAGENIVLKFLNEPDGEPEPELGSITVNKYLDADGLASTTDDRSLADSSNWTFNLYDGNGTSTQVATDGSATFNDLASGTYVVSEEVLDGYSLLAPVANLFEIELGAGEDESVDFINFREEEPGNSVIKVIKYIDQDGLASTTDDRSLATSTGWTFNLFDGAATTSQATAMASTTFGSLEAGNYMLSEQIMPAYGLLSPADNEVMVVLGEDDYMEVEFINYRLSEPDTGTITVRKYQDSDGLASTTDDRQLVSSVWTFTVSNGMSTTSQQTVNGQTVFLDLAPGEYTVSENFLSGWSYVDPANGSATTTVAVDENQTLDFINFQEPGSNGGGGNGGGGSSSGGGGSSFIPQLSIGNEQVVGSGCDYLIVSWTTSQSATSRLIYDTVSHASLSGASAPDYGYSRSGAENTDLVTAHQESIIGLAIGETYYVRPVSQAGSSEVVGAEIEINTLSGPNCVLGETGEARLTLDKEFVTNTVVPGEEGIEFVLTVTNAGNLTAFNVILSDFLPDGFSFSDSGLSQKLLNIGDLEPAASEQVSWFIDADADITAGIYTNEAQAESDNTDTVEADDDITIQAGEVLAESGFDPGEFSLLGLALLGLGGSGAILRRRLA